MGYHASFLAAENVELGDVSRWFPDYSKTNETIDPFTAATESGFEHGIALAKRGAFVIGIAHDYERFLEPDLVESLSRKGRAITVVLHSVSDTYGFCFARFGALCRVLIRSEGEVVQEVGDPIEEEANADPDFPYDEDQMFAILRSVIEDDFFTPDAIFDVYR